MAGILHQQIDLRQTSPNIYAAAWHNDWNVGPSLHGGHVAAIIHLATITHLKKDVKLAALNQPDILKLHFEFLRSSERSESIVTVTPLKLGATVSTLHLELSQNGKTKVIALATSGNFDKSLGPSAQSNWALLPPSEPVPDFKLIEAQKPEPNWLAWYAKGELMPFTQRLTMLVPRHGFKVDWQIDAWNRFNGNERIDTTYLNVMADVFQSMPDTLLRNNGLYDARHIHSRIKSLEEENPGVPVVIPNTLVEVMSSLTISVTLVLDIEFKQRLPEEGLRWIFTRVASKAMKDGRIDLEITICNEDMELVCVANQLVLVLEGQRKFQSKWKGPAL